MEYSWNTLTREHKWTFGGRIEDVSFVVADAVAQDAPNGVTYDSEICDLAMIHGFKQKIADAAAIPFAKNKRYATDAEKREAMQSVVDRLNLGQWNAERTGGKPKVVNVDALVAAIAATLKRNVVGVRAFVEGKTESGRADLANSEQFAEAYAIALAAARPTTKLDASITAELDAIPADEDETTKLTEAEQLAAEGWDEGDETGRDDDE